MALTTGLSGDQFVELRRLVKGADSIEIKLTLPEHSYRSAAAALGVDPLEAQIRQVFFFDTPELDLNKAGVVARARRVQGRGDDSVVKLRPVVPSDLPASAAPAAGVRRRGRRPAWRVRVLGITQGRAEDHGARDGRRPRGH